MEKVIDAFDQNTTKSAADRILQFLSTLKQKQCATQVVLPLSKKELALQLGMAPETFSRKLKNSKTTA